MQGQLSEGEHLLSLHLATDVKHIMQKLEADKSQTVAKEALTCTDAQQTLLPQLPLLDFKSHRLLLRLDFLELESQQKEDSYMLTQMQTKLLESFSYIQTNTVGCTLKWESH